MDAAGFDSAFDPTDSGAPHGGLEISLPIGWEIVARRRDGKMYANDHGLKVIVSGIEIDERHWIHVSVSRRSRLPSWGDLKAVKNIFIGPERKALQVLPAQSDYVNHHPYCLHLWHCLDGDPVPDFRLGAGMI